jgi:hypothetical protein
MRKKEDSMEPVKSYIKRYALDKLLSGDLGELADFLGASYRQLALAVHRFRNEGILGSRRGKISVLDAKKLEPSAHELYG